MQLAIDLPGIAKNYYKGSVEPYPSSLTSREMKGWGFPYEEWPQDLKDEYAYNPALARKLLADAGYPDGFKTNIVADTTGDLDLLQIVKEYFADIGIDMEIRPMESTDWIAYVLNGHKHDQLAQRTIAPYGHRHDPVRQMGRLRTGAASNYLMINDAILDSFQPKAIAATSEDQVKQLLRDANEYIARQHFAISLLSPGSYTLYQPWLKGFQRSIRGILFGSRQSSVALLLSGPILDRQRIEEENDRYEYHRVGDSQTSLPVQRERVRVRGKRAPFINKTTSIKGVLLPHLNPLYICYAKYRGPARERRIKRRSYLVTREH